MEIKDMAREPAAVLWQPYLTRNNGRKFSDIKKKKEHSPD